MFCKYCGMEIDADSKFCEKCGRDLIEVKEESGKANRVGNSGREISFLEIAGILICIFGVLATIFFIISINNDMMSNGLEGIRGDYHPPFTEYEKKQLLKLGISVFAVIQGVILWSMGRLGEGD